MSDITFNKVYMYDHVRQLLAVGDTFCPLRDNGPMNKNIIKCHKGLDNKVIFRVLGPDRVPFDIACGEQVYARIIDPDNRKVVVEKLCRLGPAKGLVTLELDGGDTALLAPAVYTMVLIRTEDFVANVADYYIEKPLYSDMNDNVQMEIEITEQAFKAPMQSITYEPLDWTPDLNIPTFGPVTPSFYTGRIPGGRVQNHINAVHSFSTCTQNFTGILEIWGSLEETPDPYLSPTRWFKIYPTSMSFDIEFIGYTGTQAWTFSANCMWVKFRYIPSTAVLDPGILKKLIVRT
jgi:hypothetical protein